METGLLINVFMFLDSLLLVFGSRPCTNSVSMGFYHLRTQSSGGGFSPCARSTAMTPCAVLISYGTYWFVQLCTWNGCLIVSFQFLFIPTMVRGYAAQEVCT